MNEDTQNTALHETAGFLESESTSLYGIVHHAGSDAVSARGVVVIVPPFAEEKKAAQRALVEAGREFAAAGFDVLRFDFRGTGDSGEEFGECSVEMWLEDLRAVLRVARTMAGEGAVHLVGLRFGATLAWLAADEDANVESLTLWEPIISGESYMRQNRQRSQIRRELTGDSPGEMPAQAGNGTSGFDFDGFLINPKLHKGVAEIDLLTAPLPTAKAIFLLQISGSPRIRKPLQDLYSRLEETATKADMENVFVEAFWSAIGLVDTAPVRQRTLQWLENTPVTSNGIEKLQIEPFKKSVVVQDAPRVIAEPLDFLSGDQRVHGMLYRSEGNVERAVILLHGWSGYRIGPGHLLTEAAREFAAAGYAAYSFDFRGRGESEWEVGQASLNSMIRDASRAVPIITEKTGAVKVTLLGLCSGAEVALAAGLSDSRIDSLALWSAPVFSGAFDAARQARRSKDSAKKYWHKLFLPATWGKLFSGSVNFKMVWKALRGGRSNEDAAVIDKAPDTAGQMKQFEAFRGRLLFVYGSNDPETEPSRNFYKTFLNRTKMPHRFHEVVGANHNYYSVAWKTEIIKATLQWLRE